MVRTPSPLAFGSGFYPLSVGAEMSAAEVPFILPSAEFKRHDTFTEHGFMQYAEEWTPMPSYHHQELSWQPKLTVSADLLGHYEHGLQSQHYTLYDSVAVPMVDGSQYFEQAYQVPAFDGTYTVGGQDDLAGLAAYDSMVPSFDGMLDPYVEMSCMPSF